MIRLSTPFILASASPRRREICGMAGIPVEIMPAASEPPLDSRLPLEQAVLAVARAKAAEVAAAYPDRVVIGADTVVAVGERVLGKPKDETDAAAMLRMLSGRTHRVYTGVWVSGLVSRMLRRPADSACSLSVDNLDQQNNGEGFVSSAAVTFLPMDESEIAAYIASGDPMDKAGAYGIQRGGMRFVAAVDGDFYTVMGLPGAELRRFLRKKFDYREIF